LRGDRALGHRDIVGQRQRGILHDGDVVTLKDKKAVRSQFEAWATDGLERILVSHGAPIDDPRRTLLELAGALA
jgi:hypothetical protein